MSSANGLIITINVHKVTYTNLEKIFLYHKIIVMYGTRNHSCFNFALKLASCKANEKIFSPVAYTFELLTVPFLHISAKAKRLANYRQ